MRKVFTILGIIAMILTLATGILSTDAAAKKKGEIIWCSAGPTYPEYAEGLGVNMYLNALQGRLQTHPALKGKMHLKIMDKGTLFSTQDEALTGVASGGAEMTYSGPHFLEQLGPEWKLGEAPGVFESWGHFQRAMETPPWKALHEKVAKDKGVTIIKWLFDTGDWYFYTDKGPVKTMADIKGHKIRFAGGEPFAKALKALGTTPIALPYTEVVTALQTHMIDGLITDMPAAMYFYNLDRYTKYAVLIPIAIQPICIVVNTGWYQSLKPEARQAINDVFERIDVSRFYIGFEAACIQKWRDNPKLTLVELSGAEAQRWHNTMRSALKDMLSDIDRKYIEAIDSAR
jgi:TRAP-type C4-dicarboxylate transport system substrate-binding protein